MSKDKDESQRKEEQDWLLMASRLAPLLNLFLKVLELALKFFRKV